MARDSRQRFVVKNDAEVVKIRFRENRNGAWSIYFDTYVSGKRVKESIGRELVAEKTPMDKAQNENTMMAVRVLRAEKVKEIANKGIISNSSSVKLYDFAKNIVKDNSAGRALLKMLAKNNVKMSAINELMITRMFHDEFSDDYHKGYMDSMTSELNIVIKTAIKQGIMTINPINRREIIKPYTKRKDVCYLTIDELKKFEEEYARETKPHRKGVLHTFLFSCYTGFRLSDVKSLKVSDIITEKGKPIAIDKRQVKTEDRVIVPLNKKAVALLPNISEMDKSSCVFVVDRGTQNTIVKIADKLGLGKHVSFHVARHTFATIALTLGADLYTVSKLLGHSDISITQVYAKIVDSKKKSVIDLFDNL